MATFTWERQGPSFVNCSQWWILTHCLGGSSSIQTYPALLYAACFWVNQLIFNFLLVTTCIFLLDSSCLLVKLFFTNCIPFGFQSRYIHGIYITIGLVQQAIQMPCYVWTISVCLLVISHFFSLAVWQAPSSLLCVYARPPNAARTMSWVWSRANVAPQPVAGSPFSLARIFASSALHIPLLCRDPLSGGWSFNASNLFDSNSKTSLWFFKHPVPVGRCNPSQK